MPSPPPRTPPACWPGRRLPSPTPCQRPQLGRSLPLSGSDEAPFCDSSRKHRRLGIPARPATWRGASMTHVLTHGSGTERDRRPVLASPMMVAMRHLPLTERGRCVLDLLRPVKPGSMVRSRVALCPFTSSRQVTQRPSGDAGAFSRDLRIYRKNSQPPRGRLPSRAPASASPDEALAGLLKSQADRPRRSRAPRHFSAPRHFRAPRHSRTSIRPLLRKIGRQPRNQPRRCVECGTGAIPAGTKLFPSGSACRSALEGLSNSHLYYYSNI